MRRGGGGGGVYTWSNTSVKEKVGLFAGGTMRCGAYRRRNTVFNDHRTEFHVLSFPCLYGNISSGQSCSIFISKLIRYARCCFFNDSSISTGFVLREYCVRLQCKHLANSHKISIEHIDPPD